MPFFLINGYPVAIVQTQTYINVPFDASAFSASAGLWTVSQGQVDNNLITPVGNNMWFWMFQVSGTTVTATPANLICRLPAGIVGRNGKQVGLYNCVPAGLDTELCIGTIQNGQNTISFHRQATANNWTAGATSIGGNFLFAAEAA